MRLSRHWTGKNDNTSHKEIEMKELRHMKFLLQLLQLPHLRSVNTYYLDHNKEGAFWGDHVNIGQVLDRCYSWGILTQPSSQDLDTYKDHVRDLIHAMALMNLWQFIDSYYLRDIDSVDEIRRMTMSGLTEYIWR